MYTRRCTREGVKFHFVRAQFSFYCMGTFLFFFFFAATPQAQAVPKDYGEAALLNAALTGKEPTADPNTFNPRKSK